MRKISAALFLYLAALFPAGAQIYPTNWYWQVADTSPTTQVWEGISGSFVSNTTLNFTTWLTNIANAPGITGQGLAFKICGDVNNGSGAHRLTVCDPTIGFASWSTGQTKTVTGVGGTTGANGAWVITIISAVNGTFDLQGSTFGGAYTSGGVAGTGYLIGTAVDLYSKINQYNLSLALGGSYWGVSGSIISATTVLTNPILFIQGVGMASPAQTVTMPQANLFGSIPIGYQVLFANTGLAYTIKDFGGGTIAVVPAGYDASVFLTGNASTAGNYISYLVPLPGTINNGVTCGAGLGGTSRTTSGLVTTC